MANQVFPVSTATYMVSTSRKKSFAEHIASAFKNSVPEMKFVSLRDVYGFFTRP